MCKSVGMKRGVCSHATTGHPVVNVGNNATSTGDKASCFANARTEKFDWLAVFSIMSLSQTQHKAIVQGIYPNRMKLQYTGQKGWSLGNTPYLATIQLDLSDTPEQKIIFVCQ